MWQMAKRDTESLVLCQAVFVLHVGQHQVQLAAASRLAVNKISIELKFCTCIKSPICGQFSIVCSFN